MSHSTFEYLGVWALSTLAFANAALAARNDWAEGTPGRSTGASREYYNAAGRLPWQNFMGDWRDAKDVAQGDTPYATTNVVDDDQGKFITGSDDPERKFEPLQGKLRVKIAEGATGALNTLFKFGKETGKEPEDIYFRYYLRLGDNWNQTLQGGKMPGISGTYGVAGWGGRKSDGRNGWSARRSFGLSIPADNPLGGLHPIGTYCYHADMLKIEQVWMNVYHGGKKPSPYDQHLFLDNVVIAKQYIGPIRQAIPQSPARPRRSIGSHGR